MRGGALIIGSLLWDGRCKRDKWRRTRLRTDDAMHVRVPIRYGRRSQSRGNTFTMIFASDGQLGQGVLVPFRTEVADATTLLREAKELWKAEQPSAPAESISASWGCVGVLFGPQADPGDCLRAWTDYFYKNKVPSICPVDRDGTLRIPWPVLASDGTAVGLDMILATATQGETERLCPEKIANAWIEQDQGYERYFLENIRHGIRTPDDLLVWRRIEGASPSWLRKTEYTEAIAILRGEVA